MGIAVSHIINHQEDFADVFTRRFRRPAPWIEVPHEAELTSVAESLSATLGISPVTDRVSTVLEKLHDRMAWQLREAPYRGLTEPLSIAVPRLDLPKSGRVFRCDDTSLASKNVEPLQVIAADLKDMMQFEDLLWHDFSWLIDTEARWVLYGMHDCEARCFRSSHDL